MDYAVIVQTIIAGTCLLIAGGVFRMAGEIKELSVCLRGLQEKLKGAIELADERHKINIRAIEELRSDVKEIRRY